MKTIELKKVKDFDYKANLLAILKNAPAKGYTVDDVRLAAKAIDLILDAGESVSLEDEIYNFVKKSVSETKFVTASREIADFIDYILSL